MTEIKKDSLIKKRSMFNYNKSLNNKILNNVKFSSHNNLNILSKKELYLSHSSKKRLNIVDFIMQKNKFFIENSFDINGTREFLASKEVAMRAIKLNDEIIEVKNNILTGKNNYTNKNLIKLNYNYFEEDRKKSTKTAGKNTISPRKSRKSRKSHKIRNDNEFILESISPKKTKKSKKSKIISKSPKKKKNKKIKNENKENNSNTDSKNSSDDKKVKKHKNIFEKGDRESLSNIYKFFIDNANEPEDNFNQKLEKELKKVENLNHNHNNEHNREEKVGRESVNKNKNSPKKKKPKRINSVIVKKRKGQSAFLFSEKTKNLMKNDDISLSSIGNNENDLDNSNVNKKSIKRKFASIQINDRRIKERIQEKMKKDKKNNFIVEKDISNSDKDSIISILSELM